MRNIIAVLLDMEKKETYVRTYGMDYYKENIMGGKKNDEHPTSIFEYYKDAVREAKRVAKISTTKHEVWIYNENRNK